MSIKKIFFFALMFGIFVSCSGEDKAKPRQVVVRVGGETGECLPRLGAKFSDYFADRMSEPQVHEMWDCLDGALADFEQLTTPEHPKGHEPEALARFFSKFFVKREIPPAVAEAIMNLKRIVVGGDREFLTVEELFKLREFLKHCRKWSIVLRPHIHVLMGKNPELLTDGQFQNSFQVASASFQELGLWLSNQNQTYTQKELHQLLISLKKWIDADHILQDRSKILDRAIETLPLFFRIKADFIGGNDEALKPSEWVCFMRKTTTILSTLQRLRWKLSGDRIFSVTTDSSLRSQFLDLQDFLTDVDIPFSELDEVLKMASKLSWWPKSISADNLSRTIYFAFFKILKIQKTPQEMRIDQNLVRELMRVISTFDANWNFESPSSELSELLQKVGPVDVTANGLLIYSGQEVPGAKARFQLGTVLSLVQLLRSAYGLEQFEIQNMEIIFADFLSELNRFGVLMDVDPSIAGRIYREINLFTYASNGDAAVDSFELSQYVWMILSGLNQSQMLTEAYGDSCKKSADCIYSEYTKNYSYWLSNYPKLRAFLEGESEETRAKFFEMSTVVAGSSNPVLNMVVLGYIEFFVMRYDLNQNNLVDFKESEFAFQTFGPTFTDLASSVGLKEQDSWALFTYLFKYGVNPVSEFGGLLRFVNWKLKSKEWSYEVDRVRLLQILSELKKL